MQQPNQQTDSAGATLASALRREPENFVTWALAGDLDVRRRDYAHAQAEYRRAAELDPLDAGIAAGFPKDPQAAAQLVGPRPTNVARRPNVVGYQIVKDTSPLQLARALGAPGLRASDEVVVGLFGYGFRSIFWVWRFPAVCASGSGFSTVRSDRVARERLDRIHQPVGRARGGLLVARRDRARDVGVELRGLGHVRRLLVVVVPEAPREPGHEAHGSARELVLGGGRREGRHRGSLAPPVLEFEFSHL